MTDNITLPRVVVERLVASWGRDTIAFIVSMDTLRAALAEPPAKPEPVAWMYVNLEGECEQIEYGTPSIDDDSITLLYAAPPAAAEPEPVHPGYVIGAHWLETAYSRIAAGEAEADVLTEVLGARGWVKPEPATMEQIIAAHRATDGAPWLDQFDRAWKAAERFHGIRGSKT